VGFNRAKPQERVDHTNFSVQSLRSCTWVSVETGHIYMGFLKERCIHLKNHARYGSYNKKNFARFVCSCISLSGPLSLLREP
jgi:hypothetical protein